MSNPVQRLAAAPRPPPVEELAAALQACLDDAVERGAERAKEEIKAEFGSRFDRIDARLDRQDAVLSRQNEAPRLMWRQMKGNGSFPLDEGAD